MQGGHRAAKKGVTQRTPGSGSVSSATVQRRGGSSQATHASRQTTRGTETTHGVASSETRRTSARIAPQQQGRGTKRQQEEPESEEPESDPDDSVSNEDYERVARRDPEEDTEETD